MPSTVLSAATLGIDAYPVHVEVDTDRTYPPSPSSACPTPRSANPKSAS